MLLHNKKVGALLRCFARSSEQLDTTIENTMNSIRRMQAVEVADRRFISRIEVLVPMDPHYAEMDCGETAERLRSCIKQEDCPNVFVNEVEHGDIFVSILNYGIAKLLRSGCDYGVIFSKEAETYFTPETVEDMLLAAEKGARAVGVAISELTESVMEGRIANTFAMWHLMSLVQVGCFDHRNAKPKKNAPIVHRAEAWQPDNKNFWSYDLAGVEEIIPLIRLIRTFGPCIAPLRPRGEGIPVWKTPDPRTDYEGWVRHTNKIGTKFVRQSYFAGQENVDLSFIKGGILNISN